MRLQAYMNRGVWNSKPCWWACLPGMRRAKMTQAEEEAERRGFCQGIAWAISVSFRYGQSAGGLLKESGMTVKDFKDAGVEDMDLQAVRRVARIEGLK